MPSRIQLRRIAVVLATAGIVGSFVSACLSVLCFALSAVSREWGTALAWLLNLAVATCAGLWFTLILAARPGRAGGSGA